MSKSERSRERKNQAEKVPCELYKYNRQKGQGELVLTVIIINCYLRGVEELVCVCT